MRGEVFAGLAALTFATSHVVTKRGLQRGNVIAGLLVSFSAAFVVLLIATLANLAAGPHFVTGKGALAFIVVGVVSSGVGTWASLKGIDRLGPSNSIPIQAGTRPIVGVLLALTFLGETISLREVIGIVAIIAGGVVLSRVIAGEPVPVGESSNLRALWFPIIASAAYASGDVVARYGLRDGSDPIAGAAINLAAALGAWILVAGTVPSIRRNLRFDGSPIFALAGLSLGAAMFSLYQALDTTRITTVAPIVAAQPLVVLVLAAIFLRNIDHIGPLTVGAAALVVVGTTIVVT